MFQKRSALRKKTALLGVIATAIFLAKICYDIQSDHTQVIRASEQHARGLASALNEHAQRTFNDTEGTIDSVVRSIGAASATGLPDERALQRVFAEYQRQGSILATLFVASPKGYLHAISTEYPVRPVRVDDREYFQHHTRSAESGLFISRPFRNRLDQDWLITASKRVNNPDGTLRMIVGVSVRTRYFSGFYSTLELGRNDRILLVRRDGPILSLEPFSEQILQTDLSGSSAFRLSARDIPLAGTYQIKNGPIDGTDRIVSYRRSPTYPIIAVISLSKKDQLSLWRSRTIKEIIGAVVFVGLVVSLALLIRRQMASLRVANQRLSRQKSLLKEAKERYRRISNALTDYIYTVRLDEDLGVSTRHGAGCLAVTGYTEREFSVAPLLWLEIVEERDRDAVREHTWRLARGQATEAIEHRIVRKDGQLRWVRNTPVPQVGAEGRLAEYEGLIQDITERKAAEEAQRLSERHFRDLLENVQMVSIILDPAGRVVFCNDYLLQLTGWSREETLGADWFDRFLPKPGGSAVRAVFETAMATEDIPAHFENSIVTREGVCRSIIWDNQLLHNPDGSLAGVASIGMDITQHRALEEQLRQSQKMEATGLLAGGIAHDFNNILTVIIGYCSVMQLRMDSSDPNRASVGQVISAAERAAGLTRSLLAFSRKQIMDPRPVDLNSIVCRVKEFLGRVIGEDITLRTELAAEELCVLADSGQMEQILMNLATNARDAMPDGGILTVSTRSVDLEPEGAGAGSNLRGRCALLAVSDNGTGMDEETRNKIFEPFFTTKEVGKGTGLGLAMAYGTVMQHNGSIEVESLPGQGTTFKVYLPLVSNQEPAIGRQPIPFELQLGHETILVAEDEPSVRELVEEILTKFGYRVLLACDGEEAVALFSQHQDEIALVLLDMIMPKMSGKAAYDEINRIRPGTRVLFTSGYTADVIRSKGELGPGMELVMKPVHPHVLLHKVRELLDQ